jgi:hypothetical protein
VGLAVQRAGREAAIDGDGLTVDETRTVDCAASLSSPAARPNMDVAMPPGQMALTRIPSSPNSLAAVRVRCAMAALHAL